MNSSAINQSTLSLQVFDDDIVEITEVFQLVFTAQDDQVVLSRNQSLVSIVDIDREAQISTIWRR